MNDNSDSDTEQSDPILSVRDAVRRRPGMYFGGINAEALHQVVWQAVEPFVEEAIKRECSRIDIVLEDNNSISIGNDGKGLPIEVNPETNRPLLETILLNDRSQIGLGLTAVNMVSAEFTVQVKRGGFLWQQHYQKGERQTDLEKVRPLVDDESTGTTITLKPDFGIFEQNEFDPQRLSKRLRELAFLMAGLTTTLEDRRSSGEHRRSEFVYPDGVSDYVRHLNRDYVVLHEPIAIEEEVKLKRDYELLPYTAIIAVALQFAEADQRLLLGLMNTIEVEQNGPHIKGLIWAIHRAIGDYAARTGLGESNVYNTFVEDDIFCGLTTVVSIFHPHPECDNSIRYILTNPELEDAVFEVTCKAMESFAEKHPDQMRRIVEKCLKNKALRLHRRFGDAE